MAFNGEDAMVQVVVACVAGASSTFLARRLSVLAADAGLDWNVTPSPIESIVAQPDQVVALSHHIATDSLRESLSLRGIHCVVLAEGVTGGFGAEAAAETISQFLDGQPFSSQESPEFASSQESHS